MKRWTVLTVIGVLACVLTGCVAPTFDPAGGSYPENIAVKLSCALSFESIYYTTDGSEPSTASTPYTGPIAVEGTGTNMTIKAVSVLFGLFSSAVVSATYSIDDKVQAPEFTPVAGQYDNAINVSITCATPKVAIYYTLDGTDPTTSSTLYWGSIPVAQSTRVKAIAVYTNSTAMQSSVAEADYLIGCMDSGSTAGDPHFFTYDGVVYHNQYIGEFVLTREAGKTGFEVHTRQGRVNGFSPCVTLNTAAAMRIGADKVEYRAAGDEILVNGTVVTIAEGETLTLSGGSVRRFNGIVCSDNATGATVTVQDFGNYLNVTVTAPCVLKGTMEGLMGNYDGDATNDQRLRDGTVTTDTAAFMNAWRLIDAESLFTYATGQSTATFTSVQYCDVHPSDVDLAQARQIYDGIFGSSACDAGMVYAIAIDLAAGMSETDVIAWVKSIQGYVAPKGTIWYQDADGDGYGNSDISVTACTKPEGYVKSSTDCDDANAAVNPGTTEICDDGIDNNCNGLVDECSGLVAYYPFNGNANDESGNGNNGTVYGATLTTDRFSNPNSVFYFDGNYEYINIGKSPNFNFETSVTYSMWIKPTIISSTIGNTILLKQVDGKEDKHLRLMPDGKIELCLWNCGVKSIKTNSILPLNQWTLITATFDAPTAKIYVNGLLDVSSTLGSGCIGNTTSSNMFLGYDPEVISSYPQMPFSGSLDDVRIYNRALSDAEIQQLANQ